MSWQTTERLGHFGKKRDEIFRQFDEKYDKGNWRIMWRWGLNKNLIIPYISACHIYEDAYFMDSFKREDLWDLLCDRAADVYDHDESDIESGLDYLIQKGHATHIQDIAIRNVFFRRGWEFRGNKLIQIRSHKTYWGKMLSPGKVPFHLPELIVLPHLKGWWDYNSIEDFYQSNKILQVKKK